MMKHEAMRLVNGKLIVCDLMQMRLCEILEEASSSAVAQAVNDPTNGTHREWVMVVKDAIDSDGNVYRLEGTVRVTESISRQEGLAWRVEVGRYWDALEDQRERNESHGSD